MWDRKVERRLRERMNNPVEGEGERQGMGMVRAHYMTVLRHPQ